jgi:hypothetical protein
MELAFPAAEGRLRVGSAQAVDGTRNTLVQSRKPIAEIGEYPLSLLSFSSPNPLDLQHAHVIGA